MTPSAESHISSAGRLLSLLNRIRAAKNKGSALEVYAGVVAGEEKDPSEGYRLVAEIFRLIAEARAEVNAHPELKQALYHGAISAIDTHFKNTPPNSPARTLIEPLGTLLVSLEFCADQLDRLSMETVLDSSIIASLLKLAEELSEELRDSDLPSSLKHALVRRAEELRSSLVEYSLHGARGIEQAVVAAIGTLVQHSGEVKSHRESKGLVKYFEVVSKADAAVRTVYRWGQLAAPAAKKLLALVSGDAG